MSHSGVNYHRSLFGLVAGNLLAIFISSIACLLAWQIFFPGFVQDFQRSLKNRKHQRAAEAPDKSASDQPRKRAPDGDAPSKPAEQKQLHSPAGENDGSPRESAKEANIEFPAGVLGVTIIIDGLFAAAAGYACVRIAGFARNIHALLMAMFLLVWKIQQLTGFVANQLPTSLLVAEAILLPISCVVAASFADVDEPAGSQEETSGQAVP